MYTLRCKISGFKKEGHKGTVIFSMKENLREEHKFVRLLCQTDGSFVAVIQSKYCLTHIHTRCGVLLAMGTSNLVKHQ